ncbi:MAG TPA: hypothetical protein DCM62_07090 [Bacteroidales bacterium]|nr:hypothetical protein [Bacteroidales bacterium]
MVLIALILVASLFVIKLFNSVYGKLLYLILSIQLLVTLLTRVGFENLDTLYDFTFLILGTTVGIISLEDLIKLALKKK